MKVFISGPMSGKPNCNRAAFFKAQEELEKKGYSVWNPAWLAYPSDTGFSKDAIHAIDNEALRHCDAIYMLKGWQDSKGARAEYGIAKKRDLLTIYEDSSYFGTLYKPTRVAKPIDDCYSIYDYIGPNKIDSLEKQCNDIAEDVKGIKGDIEGQDRRLDCHNNRLMSLTERVNTLSKQQKETSNKINNVNQAINDVEADLDNFKDETDGKMNDIYDTLHRHGENVDSLLTWRDTVAECYTANIANLRKEAKDIKKSIGTDNLQEQLEKDFADVYEEFQNTKDQVNDINMGYIKWSSEVSQFDERIEKLEENMKEIAANGGLGLSFNLMNERVSSNKRDISSIKNDIATIKDSIDNQRCTLDVISERIDKHYKKHNNDIDNMHSWINIHDRTYKAESKQMFDMINDLNIRLKAIEKRLSIKPFYEPTEDEKDDD